MIKKSLAILVSSLTFAACFRPPPPPEPTPEPLDPATRFTPEAYTAVQADDIDGNWVLMIQDDYKTISTELDEMGNTLVSETVTGSYRTVCNIFSVNEENGVLSCTDDGVNYPLTTLFVFDGNNLVTTNGLILTMTNNNSAIGTLDGIVEDESITVSASGSVAMVKVSNFGEANATFGTASISAVDLGSNVTETFDIDNFSELDATISIEAAEFETISQNLTTITVSNDEVISASGSVSYTVIGEQAQIIGEAFNFFNPGEPAPSAISSETDNISSTINNELTISIEAQGTDAFNLEDYSITVKLEL